MAQRRLKIIIILTITLSLRTFGQSDSGRIILKPLIKLEKSVSTLSTADPQKADTIDRKTFCNNKTKEYNALKKKLIFRLDSAKKAVNILNEKEKGPYLHYLIIKDYKGSYFDWGYCRNSTMSHDYVDLLIKFEKQEKFRVYLDGFSSGQTFYRED
jgi:hypothetical protein